MSALEHRYVVTVTGCDRAQADQVMAERLSMDEDYGFPYAVDWAPERAVQAAVDLLGPADDPVHPEYHRAIVELTATLLGRGSDEQRDELTARIDRARGAALEPAPAGVALRACITRVDVGDDYPWDWTVDYCIPGTSTRDTSVDSVDYGRMRTHEEALDAVCVTLRQAGERRRARLEHLRGELRAERISWGELAELQALAPWIDPSDTELLEAAGVPEGGAAA